MFWKTMNMLQYKKVGKLIFGIQAKVEDGI